MDLFNRLKNLLGAKLEKGMDSLESPDEMLDYSLVKMEEGLHAMAANAVQLGTSKKELELQRDTLLKSAGTYEGQSRKALELGQEDLAKEAIQRRLETEQRIKSLDVQIADMDQRLQAVARSQEELKEKIRIFKGKKEELKAVYSASQAQLKVKELITSLGNESETIGKTVERAEARIQEAQARVMAIDELVSKGVVTEVFSDHKDDVEYKLNQLSMNATVEAELIKLKKICIRTPSGPSVEGQPFNRITR
ncbi:pspa/im30 [Lucifera butyrica]|uniref:Pspa/im30 n=1 Tax=Lucifera butyrica TaxID=1351585 RepID=A0A498RDH7_9FIRM|nr:PspA/IM30 family protein [Lucifera butyrica]VBB08900.1 pspa/im30 [Lucifera butyrica]